MTVLQYIEGMTTIRMTASAAERILSQASAITAEQLTERHIDVLQMQDIDIATRAMLGDASDDLRAGMRDSAAIRHLVAEWNVRCGGAAQSHAS